MAEEHDDDVLDLDTSMEVVDTPADGDDDVTIEIEGDDAAEETPLIRTLRQRERDLARENAELRKASAPKAIEVGDEPDLEQFDWDQDKFKQALRAWNERKQAKERQDREQGDAEQARNRTFERAMETYRGQAAQLGVKGYAEAEKAVMDALPDPVKQTIVQYFKEPAKLVAALGKSPARLAAISSEPDHMRMVMQLKDLEGSIKVVNKRRPPEPEADTIQRGSASVAVSSSAKQLEKLEKEAERTGDRTKIIAFKRAEREKKK